MYYSHHGSVMAGAMNGDFISKHEQGAHECMLVCEVRCPWERVWKFHVTVPVVTVPAFRTQLANGSRAQVRTE